MFQQAAPLRVEDEIFENETVHWVRGWTHSDATVKAWSNCVGTVSEKDIPSLEQALKLLPDDTWSWDTDWQVDLAYAQEVQPEVPANSEGWVYGKTFHDVPKHADDNDEIKLSKEEVAKAWKQGQMMFRRRRWIRHRIQFPSADSEHSIFSWTGTQVEGQGEEQERSLGLDVKKSSLATASGLSMGLGLTLVAASTVATAGGSLVLFGGAAVVTSLAMGSAVPFVGNDKPAEAMEEAALEMKTEGVMLEVQVLEAQGLQALDTSGLSDPYVTVEMDSVSEVFTTATIKKSLSPAWEETFYIRLPQNKLAQGKSLTLFVRSRSFAWKDGFLGFASIPVLEALTGADGHLTDWYELQPLSETASMSAVSGKIRFSVRVVPVDESRASIGAADPSTPLRPAAAGPGGGSGGASTSGREGGAWRGREGGAWRGREGGAWRGREGGAWRGPVGRLTADLRDRRDMHHALLSGPCEKQGIQYENNPDLVDGLFWWNRHFVLSTASLQIFPMNETTPDIVLPLDAVVEVVPSTKEERVLTLVTTCKAAALLPNTSPAPRVSYRIRVENMELRDRLVQLVEYAQRHLQAASLLQRNHFPAQAPDVDITFVTLQTASACEYILLNHWPVGVTQYCHMGSLPLAATVNMHVRTPAGTKVIPLQVGELLVSADRGDVVCKEVRADNALQSNLQTYVKMQVKAVYSSNIRSARAAGASWRPWSHSRGALLGGALLATQAATGAAYILQHLPPAALRALVGALALLLAAAWLLRTLPIVQAAQRKLFAKLGVGYTLSLRIESLEAGNVKLSEDFDPDNIPERFLLSCPGDRPEAKRRYLLSIQWKAENEIATILEREQPHFHEVKDAYVHCFHKTDKKGRPVYIEQMGHLATTVKLLEKKNLPTIQILRHCAFVTEYLWREIDPSELPGGQMVRIVDVQGVSLGDMGSSVFNFIRDVGNMYGVNYPERQAMIFIINVPAYFTVLWNFVKPLIRPITVSKTRVLQAHQVKSELLKVIPAENLPKQYGGKCECKGGPLGCFRHAPEEETLFDFVEALTPPEKRRSSDSAHSKSGRKSKSSKSRSKSESAANPPRAVTAPSLPTSPSPEAPPSEKEKLAEEPLDKASMFTRQHSWIQRRPVAGHD